MKRLVTGRKTCDRSCPGFTVPFGHLSSRHPRSAHPFRSSVRRFLRHFVSLLTPFTRVAIPFPHALRRYAHSFGRLVGKRGLRREETEEQSGAGSGDYEDRSHVIHSPSVHLLPRNPHSPRRSFSFGSLTAREPSREWGGGG